MTERLHIVTDDQITPARRATGRAMVWGGLALLVVVAGAQFLGQTGRLDLGFSTWRPTLYAFCLFAVLLCAAQVVLRGEQGKRALFVLPAALFVGAMVIFPLIFGIGIALSDWNLASPKRAAVQWPRQSAAGLVRSVLLERASQHGALCRGDRGRIRHRLWPRAGAQRRDPRPESSFASRSCCR